MITEATPSRVGSYLNQERMIPAKSQTSHLVNRVIVKFHQVFTAGNDKISDINRLHYVGS